MSEVNEQAELKGNEISPIPRLVMIAHGVLAFLGLAVICALSIGLQEFFEGLCMTLPTPTRLALNLSYWCREWIMLVVPVLGGLLWLDGKCYVSLYQRVSRKAALIWFWAVTSFLVVFPILIFVAMYIPIHLLRAAKY